MTEFTEQDEIDLQSDLNRISLMPLVPKSQIGYNADALPTLRGVFQDIFQETDVQENVIQNMAINKLDSLAEKNVALSTVEVWDECQKNTKVLREAEIRLNNSICEYEDRKKLIENEPKLKYEYNLHPYKLFPDVNERDVKTYALITSKDFLPSAIDRAIDFTYNKSHKCTKTTCSSQLDLLPSNSPKIKECTKQKKTLAIKQSVDLKEASSESKHFCLNVNVVEFLDYCCNVTYKKTFKLQNISPRLQIVCINQHPTKSCFNVRWNVKESCVRLSSGMCITFTVTFRTEHYIDVEDEYEICGHVVTLRSYRTPPHLFMFLIRPELISSKLPIDQEQIESIDDALDCGSCFLGEVLDVCLIFKNSGSAGRFFIMSQEEWANEEEFSQVAQSLKFDEFCIEPRYFELESNEFTMVSMSCNSEVAQICRSKIYVICNNATWHNIDIIADVILFDEHAISFETDSVKRPQTIWSNLKLTPHLQFDTIDTFENRFCMRPEIGSLRSSVSNKDVALIECEQIQSPSTTSQSYLTLSETPSSVPMTIQSTSIDEPTTLLPPDDSIEIFNYLLQQENAQRNTYCDEEECVTPPANLIINFGSLLGFRTAHRLVKIYNHSGMCLKYRWEFRDLNKRNYCTSINRLKPDWMKIEGSEDILHENSEIHFHFQLIAKTVCGGYYGTSIAFIIEGIPVKAIKTANHLGHFKQLEETELSDEDGVERADVQIEIFDLICYVEDIRFQFCPPKIAIKNRETNASSMQVFQMGIKCNYDDEVFLGEWAPSNHFEIHPQEFTISAAQGRRDFIFLFHGNKPNECHEYAHVMLNNLFCSELMVDIAAAIPSFSFNRKSLDLGTLIVGNTYAIPFRVLNRNNVLVYWEMHEIYSSSLKFQNMAIKISYRILDCGDLAFTYTVSSNTPLVWSSRIAFIVRCHGKLIQSACMDISYNFANTPIVLHTFDSQCPLLTPAEPLYVNASNKFPLCFHNCTDFRTHITAGEPFGHDLEHFDVQVEPFRFHINAHQIRRVDLSLVPTKVGIFREIYIPFVLNNMQPYLVGEFNAPPPTVLKVLLCVEDISVKILIPCDRRDEPKEIIWPPKVAQEFAYSEQSETECSLESYSSSLFEDTELDELPADVVNYLKEMKETVVEEAGLSGEQRSSDTLDTTSCAGFSNMNANMELVMHICRVPLRQPVTRRIKLENRTPVNGVIQIDILHYPCKQYTKPKIDGVLERLDYKSNDEWGHKVSDQGIGVMFEYVGGMNEIKGFGSSEIMLTIYANTWGVYQDCMLIDFNNILPLTVNIIMEVVGSPLEFPIAREATHRIPILRFGTHPYHAPFATRQVYVKNTSAIPILVVWHICMRTKLRILTDEPRTLLFENHQPKVESCGKTSTCTFPIEPKETLIEAGATCALRVGFQPDSIASTYKMTSLEAYLLGNIQLPEEYRFCQHMFKRPVGTEIPPGKVKITATLEQPTLMLDASVEDDARMDLHIGVIAETGWDEQKRSFKCSNAHDFAIRARIEIDPPFHLGNRRSCAEIVLPPHEDISLTVYLRLAHVDMSRIAQCLFGTELDCNQTFYKEHCNMTKKSCTLTKYLHLIQAGLLSQSIPFTMHVEFPRLQVVKAVNFDNVYVGDVVRKIITIKNYSKCPFKFATSNMKYFECTPKEGEVAGGSEFAPAYIEIAIDFTPRICGDLSQVLNVHTSVPYLMIEICLRGVGTRNEQFAKHNIC